jgi:aspartyl-tRNA(Asn)/glutamyl-tRNA(Gln) amidotransferase subunit A
MAEGGALHLDRLRARAADYDPDTRDRLLAGAMLPAAWVVKAQKLRRWFREQALEMFKDVDVLLAPATPARAPALGQKTMTIDGAELPVRANLGLFTQPISFIGLPVVAVPLWQPGSMLPTGCQVIAPPWREDLALRVAAQLEREGVTRAPIGRAAEV